MSKLKIECAYCGKEIQRYPSQIKGVNCCSRECLGNFMSKDKNPEGYKFRCFAKNSKRMAEMNKKLNPERMTFETRKKLREARLGTGEGKTYAKTFGVHTHRIVAEKKLGRKLRPGEVVHHIDGNKRNNNPDNLHVFSSQAEHARWHIENDERR